jgi:hypothetical protein
MSTLNNLVTRLNIAKFLAYDMKDKADNKARIDKNAGFIHGSGKRLFLQTIKHDYDPTFLVVLVYIQKTNADLPLRDGDIDAHRTWGRTGFHLTFERFFADQPLVCAPIITPDGFDREIFCARRYLL